MKKTLGILALMSMMLGLTACAKHRYYDQNQARSIRPIAVPASIRFEAGEQYYAVPRSAYTGTARRPVSLVPPGSHLERFNSAKKNSRGAR